LFLSFFLLFCNVSVLLYVKWWFLPCVLLNLLSHSTASSAMRGKRGTLVFFSAASSLAKRTSTSEAMKPLRDGNLCAFICAFFFLSATYLACYACCIVVFSQCSSCVCVCVFSLFCLRCVLLDSRFAFVVVLLIFLVHFCVCVCVYVSDVAHVFVRCEDPPPPFPPSLGARSCSFSFFCLALNPFLICSCFFVFALRTIPMCVSSLSSQNAPSQTKMRMKQKKREKKELGDKNMPSSSPLPPQKQ
jgi:hypothetical protein